MSKHKHKKEIKFWEDYLDTIIAKGAKEEIRRIERRYENHRFKHQRKKNLQLN